MTADTAPFVLFAIPFLFVVALMVMATFVEKPKH